MSSRIQKQKKKEKFSKNSVNQHEIGFIFERLVY